MPGPRPKTRREVFALLDRPAPAIRRTRPPARCPHCGKRGTHGTYHPAFCEEHYAHLRRIYDEMTFGARFSNKKKQPKMM